MGSSSRWNLYKIMSKDFDLRYEKRPDYLYVFVKGPEDTLEISKRMWDETYRIVKETNSDKLLIEEDFGTQVELDEIFSVLRYAANLFGPNIKVAHVDRRSEDLELNKFGENMMKVLKIDAAVFDNFHDAESWLLSGPASRST